MTWIKICGITNVEDALGAIEGGADALGFVFCEKSPRNLQPERVREIVRELPSHTERVGVFVSDSTLRAREIAGGAGLTAIQQHVLNPGAFSLADSIVSSNLSDGLKVFVSLPAAFFLDHPHSSAPLAGILERMLGKLVAERSCGTLFLDSGTHDQPGGTGKSFDWDRAVPLAEELRHLGMKLVLSGGLTAENVSRAIEVLHPWGVDVSSGVEATPGKKDAAKIRAFISSVREVESASLKR